MLVASSPSDMRGAHLAAPVLASGSGGISRRSKARAPRQPQCPGDGAGVREARGPRPREGAAPGMFPGTAGAGLGRGGRLAAGVGAQ